MSLLQMLLTARSAVSTGRDAQGFVPSGFENLQEMRKKVIPPWITTIGLSSCIKKSQYKLIVPHLPVMHCCKKRGCFFSNQLLGTHIAKAVSSLDRIRPAVCLNLWPSSPAFSHLSGPLLNFLLFIRKGKF